MPHAARAAIIALLLPWLSFCASQDFEDEENWNAEKGAKTLYEKAHEQIDKRLYVQALTVLTALQARFPESPYAAQAQLESIYVHYRNFDQTAASEVAESFVKLHAQHPQVDYAYYMLGLAPFESARRSVSRFSGRLGSRNIEPARIAYRQFTRFLDAFPGSAYAADARQRVLYLREMMAAHEIFVAGHYLSLGAWLAAANRGQYVLDHFPRTASVTEALRVMATAYRRLGLAQRADDALAILAANAPERRRGGGALKPPARAEGKPQAR